MDCNLPSLRNLLGINDEQCFIRKIVETSDTAQYLGLWIDLGFSKWNVPFHSSYTDHVCRFGEVEYEVVLFVKYNSQKVGLNIRNFVSHSEINNII